MFIEIYGKHGDTGRVLLDNKRNNFERGQTDIFLIGCVDLGEIKKIRLGHDNSG